MELNTEDFLWQSYFGITKTKAQEQNNKDDLLNKCIDLAFIDLARTVKYDNISTKLKNSSQNDGSHKFLNPKDDFKNTKKSSIYKGINEELFCIVQKNPGASEDDLKKIFNRKHKEICEKICDENTEKHEALKSKLTYGQAQKWLNMTLKYMALMGLWKIEMNDIEKFLHVPLDSYILKALFYIPGRKGKESLCKQINDQYKKEDKKEEHKNTNLINSEHKNYVNSDGKLLVKDNILVKTDDWDKDQKKITWSSIETYDDYDCIQKAVKGQIPDEFKSDPLVWENKVWIYASQFINGKNDKMSLELQQ